MKISIGDSRSSKTMEIADDVTLPEDIILQSILPRLPVKSAIRLQVVSKTWYYFIKRPLFTRLQFSISRNRNPRKFLIWSQQSYPNSLVPESVTVDGGSIKGGGSEFAPLDDVMRYFFGRVPCEVIGVCAGVICVAFGSTAFLWNPAIGVSIGVSLSGSRVDLGQRKVRKFGFIGFGGVKDGFGNVVNFKLLMMGEEFRKVGFAFLIYSVNIKKWRVLQSPTFEIKKLVDKCCLNINGVLYWLTWGDNSSFVLTFDVTSETFGRIRLPDRPAGPWREHEKYLTVFEDRHLMLIVPMEYEGQVWLDRWVLFDDGRKGSSQGLWLQAQVLMGPMRISGTMLGYCDGVGVLAQDIGELYLHDAEGKVSKCAIPIYKAKTCVEYQESLVSPKCISEQDDFQTID